MRYPRARWLLAALALALLASACGSSGRGTDPNAANDGGGSSATSAVDTSTAFGDLESPCGPAEDGATNAAGEQGVTADSVTIGYGDDAGYQGQPGVNHEMADAVEAIIGWCNEQGGINGREVVGNYYDAAILEAGTVVQEACREVFMLVGQGWALDDAAEQDRLACGLPSVPGYNGSAVAAMGPLMVAPVPNPIDYYNTQQGFALAEAFPEQVTKTATVFPPLPASIAAKDKMKATYPAAGFGFLDCDQQYQLAGEADWKPFAQRLKDCGAEAVYFTGAEGNFENLLDAAAQLDYHPIWFVEANFYTSTFAAWNQNGNADEVYVKDSYVPLFLADTNPATQQYIDIVEASGGDISQLGEQATSAFLLWATAAKECGAELTRDCVMGHLYDVHEWTGGGLHAQTDPGANLLSQCGNVLKMDGTTWTQWSPEEKGEYQCDPKFLAPVDPPAPIQGELQLDADRKAQQYAG